MALGDFAISENAGLQTVNLSGISSARPMKIQTLTVNAVSSNRLCCNPAFSLMVDWQ